VRRVRPPKMTSPKTLAALPSSQYATLLLFVSGKNDFVAGVVFCAAKVLPRLPMEDDSPERLAVDACRTLAWPCERKALRKAV